MDEANPKMDKQASDHTRKLVFCHSVEHCKPDVGIELTSLDSQSVATYGLNHGERLSRPGWVIQLIKRDDRSLGHPWKKAVDRDLRRLIEIEIKK